MKLIDLLVQIEEKRIIPNTLYRINIHGYNLIVKFLYFDLIIVSYDNSIEYNYLKLIKGESLFRYFNILAILGYKIEEVK